MIYTVTLNPALDKTMYYEKVNIGKVNVCNQVCFEAGGKGINTAKVLKMLGSSVTSVALLGGYTGEKIVQRLDNVNLKQDNVYTNKETRTNTKIVDKSTTICTELNENTTEFDFNDLKCIDNKIADVTNNAKYITFSGSVPKGFKSDVYAKYIKVAKDKGIKTIVDTSGDALVYAIKEMPWLIKPNIDELSQYFNEKLQDEKNIIQKCKLLNNLGVELVVVTLGEEGLICTSDKNIYVIRGYKVNVISTVGAGDSFIGGFIFKYDTTKCIETSLKYGMAVALNKITSKGDMTLSLDSIDKFYNELNVEIYN